MGKSTKKFYEEVKVKNTIIYDGKEVLCCQDCGSRKSEMRSFNSGGGNIYIASQCNTCWKESLYEDLLD